MRSPGRGVDCWVISSGSGVLTIRTDPADTSNREDGGLVDRSLEEWEWSFPLAWRYVESSEDELRSRQSPSDTIERLLEAMDSGKGGIRGARSLRLVGR